MHLGDDLARREVAASPPEAGDAEAARQRAAGLARDAQRVAAAIGNVDRFDRRAVLQAKEELARPVLGLVELHDPRQVEPTVLGHSAPQVLAQGRDLVERIRALPVHGVEDLAGTKGPVDPGRQGGRQLGARQSEEVDGLDCVHGLSDRVASDRFRSNAERTGPTR